MKRYKRHLITLGIGLAFSLFVLMMKGTFKSTNSEVIFKDLTDAFFSAGILIFGFGLLVVASNGGTFDMLAFGVRKVFDLFRRDLTKAKYKTFYDYRVAQEENKSDFWYLVVVGLFLIGVSLIFLWRYNQIVG